MSFIKHVKQGVTGFSASAGDLYDKLVRTGTAASLTGSQLQCLARQLLEAVQHIHSLGVIHRDIKPENILMKGDGGILLADFGLAEVRASKKDGWSASCGTYGYIAPEVFYINLNRQGMSESYYGHKVSPTPICLCRTWSEQEAYAHSSLPCTASCLCLRTDHSKQVS